MSPARSFGPDVAIGELSTWWVYLVGTVVGSVVAVGVARVLRGPATAQEAHVAMGTPLTHADGPNRPHFTASSETASRASTGYPDA